MNDDQVEQLTALARRLSEALMTAAICADEIHAILEAAQSHRLATSGWRSDTEVRHPPRKRPLVDDTTFSVYWAGRTCCLRRTILFRLARRLARYPNQFITADQLLRDVWEGGVRSPDTVRSAVRHLRHRLTCAGMHDLAGAIHGTGGCYGLMLDGQY